MGRLRKSSLSHPLSATIDGYEGYESADTAPKTNQVFLEELSERISELEGFEKRLRRTCEEIDDHGATLFLDRIREKLAVIRNEIAKATSIAGCQCLCVDGTDEELEAIDEKIVEKFGSINQALALIDLEGGMGLEQADLEGVLELLDDVNDLLYRRTMLLSG